MTDGNHAIPVIFGEVLFDCFPDGNSVLGGAPFNVAWHLQAFGLSPIVISSIGDDELGKKVKSAMLDWNMSARGCSLILCIQQAVWILSSMVENRTTRSLNIVPMIILTRA